MPTPITAVHQRLAAIQEVTDAVGDRIHTEHVPQADNILPYILFAVGSEDRNTLLSGQSNVRDVEVEIAIFSDDEEQRETLATLIKDAFDDAGNEGEWDGLVVQGCFMDEDSEDTNSIKDSDLGIVLYGWTAKFDLKYERESAQALTWNTMNETQWNNLN